MLVELDDPSAGWVEGYVRSTTLEELEGPLDRYEEVGSGLFRRVETTTRDNRRVWIYLYSRPVPSDAVGPIERWRQAKGVVADSSCASGGAGPTPPGPPFARGGKSG